MCVCGRRGGMHVLHTSVCGGWGVGVCVGGLHVLHVCVCVRGGGGGTGHSLLKAPTCAVCVCEGGVTCVLER